MPIPTGEKTYRVNHHPAREVKNNLGQRAHRPEEWEVRALEANLNAPGGFDHDSYRVAVYRTEEALWAEWKPADNGGAHEVVPRA